MFCFRCSRMEKIIELRLVNTKKDCQKTGLRSVELAPVALKAATMILITKFKGK